MNDSSAKPLTLLDGKVTGFAEIPDDSADRPLVVFLHGGGADALETMLPGHSQLGVVAHNGYPAFALNRPGYRDSALPSRSEGSDGWFAASAQRLNDAIAELWEQVGERSRGVVIHGCSIGGAISLTLASQWSANAERGDARWPLLGVAVVDIGHIVPERVRAQWHNTEDGEFVADLRAVADLPTPPTWSLPILQRPDAPARIPRAELLEIVDGWQQNWRSVASTIAVPVHYRLAEHDVLWEVGDEIIDEMLDSLRIASPYVDGKIVPGASHPVMDGPLGQTHTFETLAFTALCHAASVRPEILADRSVAP